MEHDADRLTDSGRFALDVVACDPRAAIGGSQQGRQHGDRGGLAGAVWSEEAEDLAPPDREVHVIHGDEVAEPSSKVLDDDRGRMGG